MFKENIVIIFASFPLRLGPWLLLLLLLVRRFRFFRPGRLWMNGQTRSSFFLVEMVRCAFFPPVSLFLLLHRKQLLSQPPFDWSSNNSIDLLLVYYGWFPVQRFSLATHHFFGPIFYFAILILYIYICISFILYFTFSPYFFHSSFSFPYMYLYSYISPSFDILFLCLLILFFYSARFCRVLESRDTHNTNVNVAVCTNIRWRKTIFPPPNIEHQ